MKTARVLANVLPKKLIAVLLVQMLSTVSHGQEPVRTCDQRVHIEFRHVASITKDRPWGAEVTLLDGRTLLLEDSNDVDDRNGGIFVTLENGRTELVSWSRFARVTLAP